MRTRNLRVLLSAFNVSSIVSQCSKRAENFARVQGAIFHLRILRALRASYISIFQIIFFCIFFLMGLIFLHAGAILMATSGVTRFSVGLVTAGILETAAPIIFAVWFTSADRMLRQAAKGNPVLKEYLKKRSVLDED